jgi:hypothetical protein
VSDVDTAASAEPATTDDMNVRRETVMGALPFVQERDRYSVVAVRMAHARAVVRRP